MKKVLLGLAVLCGLFSYSADATPPVYSQAVETCHVLKNSSGSMYGFSVFNAGAATAYVMVFNSSTAPSNGTVTPVHQYPVNATSSVAVAWGPPGQEDYSQGITICLSSTSGFTFTGYANAIISGDVQ